MREGCCQCHAVCRQSVVCCFPSSPLSASGQTIVAAPRWPGQLWSLAVAGMPPSLCTCMREVAVSEINAQTLTIVQISSPSIWQGHCSFFFYCLVCFFLRVFFVSLCYDVGCMYIAMCNARHDRQKWGMMASCSARLVPVM